MPQSFDPQPVHFKRVFFDLPPAVAEALKVRAAQERKYMRVLLAEIVIAYLEETPKRGTSKK